jgi:hypothetical protein
VLVSVCGALEAEMTYTRSVSPILSGRRQLPRRKWNKSSDPSRLTPFSVSYSKIVNDLLAELEDNITREKLRSLLHHSRRLTGFNNRATGVMECIEEVLENGSSRLPRPSFPSFFLCASGL